MLGSGDGVRTINEVSCDSLGVLAVGLESGRMLEPAFCFSLFFFVNDDILCFCF